jgi:hypothetical protein
MPEEEPQGPVGDVDYSDEPPLDPGSLLEPGTEPYDPEPQRENVRLLLAASLVGLVILEVAGAFIAMIAGTAIEDLRALLQIVFAPSVALAGSATGFYFAGQR